MKKVFVTGSNGLVGTNLINLLLKRGFYVIGLIRDQSKYKGHISENLTLITGGLFDDFTQALKDVDYVVHVAAVTNPNLLKYEDYSKTNRDATLRLYQASSANRIKKFIYVSSVNTIGHGTIEDPGTEEKPVREPFLSSLYARSKVEAEEIILAQKNGPEVIILNPAFILGEYISSEGSGKIIQIGLGKKIIFYPPGGKSFVHVSDVAEGIIQSFSCGKRGNKYILANENLSYYTFFKKMNEIAKQKPLMIKIPEFILLLSGLFGELLRIFEIKTSLSFNNMKILCAKNFYSNNKSVEELGVKYHSVDQVITDSIDYFKT